MTKGTALRDLEKDKKTKREWGGEKGKQSREEIRIMIFTVNLILLRTTQTMAPTHSKRGRPAKNHLRLIAKSRTKSHKTEIIFIRGRSLASPPQRESVNIF